MTARQTAQLTQQTEPGQLLLLVAHLLLARRTVDGRNDGQTQPGQTDSEGPIIGQMTQTDSIDSPMTADSPAQLRQLIGQ